MRILSIFTILLVLTACVTTAETNQSSYSNNMESVWTKNFTTEKIMSVRQGMTSDEILTMFGEPKDIEIANCGMPPNQWVCTSWEYGDFPLKGARFIFADVEGEMLLNNFDIER